MTKSMCSCDVNRDCHSVVTISNRVEPRPACVAALHPWLHGSDTRRCAADPAEPGRACPLQPATPCHC